MACLQTAGIQLIASAMLLSIACAPAPAPATSKPAAPARHLVVVTIDTLRADRVGAYGNSSVATPNIDRIAQQGALATHAAVHVPLTRPSHVSLFTGLYPSEHGIRDNVSPPLGASVPVLAEMLQQQGFRTAAFVSSIVLSRQSGLARGFVHYSDKFDIGEDDARFLNTIQKRGDRTTEEAIAWLRQPGSERRFAWIHLYDPHDPYEPPEPYASRYAGRPYDGEVAWSDELVGRIDTALGDAGLGDDTLLVVTSDHGEGLDEHGEAVHGFFVYETTLRVPLVARGPGITPGTRVDVVARTIDLLPTLLDLLALATPRPPMSGRSLSAALRGEALEDEPSFAESLVPLVHYGWSDLRSLRIGRWKYILAPRPELYDLERDGGERENLLQTEPARARALRAALEQQLKQERTALRGTATAAPAIPPDLLEKLGALGYVSGGTSTALPTGEDPKDKIAEYQAVNTLMREGLVSLREQRYAVSLDRFNALFKRGIDSFEAHYYAARALAGLSRWREAARHYESALRQLPAYSAAYLGLADAHLADGKPVLALDALTRGQQALPADARLVDREGDIARQIGDSARAARAWERVAAMAPDDALVRVKLGELHRDAGRPDEAARLLRDALTLDPSVASYWNSLGMILGGAGDLAAAERAFREAVTRDQGNAQYSYNLGLALARQNKRAEAAAAFERTLAIDPRFAPARQRLAEMR
jgi:arylsulfatase A-like enzyme/predicted Zn-dependent protease